MPANQKNPNTRRAGQVEGEVEIVGIVRLGEKRAPFTPENQPHTWFYRCVLCRGNLMEISNPSFTLKFKHLLHSSQFLLHLYRPKADKSAAILTRCFIGERHY